MVRTHKAHFNETEARRDVSIYWTLPHLGVSSHNMTGAWLTYAWEDYPECVLGDLEEGLPASQLMLTPVELV